MIGGLYPAYCPGAPTTQLWATPPGGIFTIAPSPASPGAITPNGVFSPSALAPGVYTIHYHAPPTTAGCGFHASAQVTISGPMNLTPTILHPTCNTCADGSITVVVSGGLAPYQYSMQALGATVISSSPIFSNLSPGMYTIVVTDAAGCSQTITVTLAPQANCPPPMGVHATQVTGTSAHLAWNPVPGAQSYTVRYRRAGVPAWTLITVPNNSAVLQGLAANAEYIVQVRSNCGNSISVFGPPLTFVTSNILPALCVNPSPLMVQASYTMATVFWPPVPGASSYQLQFRRANNTLWTTVNVQAPITSFVINGLTPGTQYVVRIRTRCGNTVAAWSPEVSFTTLSGRVGYEPQTDLPLAVYPNPNKGMFQVEFSTSAAGRVPLRLLDVAGRAVWSDMRELEAGTHSLSVQTDVPAGM
ncbi:MAG: fibronectin type III domain-containing protein, partial [Bacteroidia bacterium]|nr:fibronectin type III domain-containing protein [Bacteroidia bacterium]